LWVLTLGVANLSKGVEYFWASLGTVVVEHDSPMFHRVNEEALRNGVFVFQELGPDTIVVPRRRWHGCIHEVRAYFEVDPTLGRIVGGADLAL